jgi:hypothetical protein
MRRIFQKHYPPCLACGEPAIYFSAECGRAVCTACEDHPGLARCFCGWSRSSPGRGREELEELGERIEPEE